MYFEYNLQRSEDIAEGEAVPDVPHVVAGVREYNGYGVSPATSSQFVCWTKKNPKILNGRMYILDLVGNPSILCYLTKTEGGYIASYENSRYSDDFIPYDEVTQIYKVVGLIRSFE